MNNNLVADNDLIGEKEMKATFNHVVDYIMAKRVGLTGKVEYLVKWEGWPSNSATWEPSANFASPKIIDIFEAGLRKQLGEEELPLPHIQSTSAISVNKNKPKSGLKRKSKWSEPMASKLFEDLRIRSRKQKRGPQKRDISAHKLFDVDVSRIENVIKKYEPLVGASKRKSRMSCPSSPIKVKVSSKPLILSDRSQRYRIRYQSKVNSDNSLSNKSFEENKNPHNEHNINQSTIHSNSITPKSSRGRKRQMKVNNDSNKMTKTLNQNSSTILTQMSDKSIESQKESPPQMFMRKVKDRFNASPQDFQKFLNEILEFQTINLEFKKLLNNNEELIADLFNILFINRKNLLIKDNTSLDTLDGTQNSDQFDDFSDQINEEVNQWLLKVNQMLETQQKTKFWAFIENKEAKDIMKASPAYLWLRINRLFSNHKDLSEDFKMFMPTLCSKVHHLYSNLSNCN